jgi:hypothetical protein
MEPLLTAFLVITGIQLFVSGLLGDILVKTYYDRTNDVPYSIKEVIENQQDDVHVRIESPV